MIRLFEDITTAIVGQGAPTRTHRFVRRMLGIGAMVGTITLLGPVFGYGFMAIVGVFVMLLTRPENVEH